jgi:integrase/recombinase XerD
VDARLRAPPRESEIESPFHRMARGAGDLPQVRPDGTEYAVARLAADVGLRINEIRMLDLADVRWELGRFGRLNVRHGNGSGSKGPEPRLGYDMLVAHV